MRTFVVHVRSCVLAAFCAAPAGALADKITIDGSTGLTPLVAALAKAYMAQRPGTAVEIGKGLGTRARIQALADGGIDIAMASHGLDVDAVQRQGMAVLNFGKVPVIFAANAAVAPSDLAESQICGIYSGAITNWSALGGADLAVIPLTRPESEVDTEVVRDKIACLRHLELSARVKVMPKAPDMANALATTKGAVGMTTTTVVEQSGGQVKALSIAGAAPTLENVQSRRYALTRDSFLVTRAEPSPEVKRFLDFVRSAAGEKVIVANGAVPAR